MAEVLTRAVAIPQNTAPDGRRYGIFRLQEGSLWDVRQIRLDEQEREIADLRAMVPEQFQTRFTSNTRAQEAIRRYLIQRWDESDEIRERTMRRKGVTQSAETVEASA